PELGRLLAPHWEVVDQKLGLRPLEVVKDLGPYLGDRPLAFYRLYLIADIDSYAVQDGGLLHDSIAVGDAVGPPDHVRPQIDSLRQGFPYLVRPHVESRDEIDVLDAVSADLGLPEGLRFLAASLAELYPLD